MNDEEKIKELEQRILQLERDVLKLAGMVDSLINKNQ